MYFSRDGRGAPDVSVRHDIRLNGNDDIDDDLATRSIAAIRLPRDVQRIVAVPRDAIWWRMNICFTEAPHRLLEHRFNHLFRRARGE